MLTPGTLICRKTLFGANHRYAVAPVWTRFNTVQWFVWDAYTRDDFNDGKAAVIRQADSFAEALAGFEADVAEYFENAES